MTKRKLRSESHCSARCGPRLRNDLRNSAAALLIALAFSSVLCAQTTRAPASASRTATAQAPPARGQKAKALDPHDLNGIWVLTPRRQMAITENRPPLTPWGQAKLNQVRSSWTNSALGIKAAPENEWNDPLYRCDPAGYPRTMQQIFGEIMRFVQTPNELLEFFEWDHTWRDIWTDGRKLHDDPEPRYYGYAVGRWEDDTFVVNSNGFNDRTWLDPWGDVHSSQMRLRETFRRTGPDRLEWTITVEDPMTYTRPWGPSDTRIFQLVPKSPRSEYEELREDFCVWSDSSGFFRDADTTGVGDAPARGKQ
jgi:hypothetical protein